jgi:ABC-type Mn2+/Zn2+ transport system permease subunit
VRSSRGRRSSLSAAVAVRLTKRPLYAVVLSILVALFATWVGLFVQFYAQYPASFFIVTIAFSVYVVVWVGQAISSKLVRRTVPAFEPGSSTGPESV